MEGRGVTDLYFETGCEGHRWSVLTSDAVVVQNNEWFLSRDERYQLQDGDWIQIKDRDAQKVIFEGTLEFRPAWDANDTYYPDDYTYAISLRRIPVVDMALDDFIELFFKRHPCEFRLYRDSE